MFRDDEMMVKNEMRKNSFDDMMDGAMMMKYDWWDEWCMKWRRGMIKWMVKVNDEVMVKYDAMICGEGWRPWTYPQGIALLYQRESFKYQNRSLCWANHVIPTLRFKTKAAVRVLPTRMVALLSWFRETVRFRATETSILQRHAETCEIFKARIFVGYAKPTSDDTFWCRKWSSSAHEYS